GTGSGLGVRALRSRTGRQGREGRSGKAASGAGPREIGVEHWCGAGPRRGGQPSRAGRDQSQDTKVGSARDSATSPHDGPPLTRAPSERERPRSRWRLPSTTRWSATQGTTKRQKWIADLNRHGPSVHPAPWKSRTCTAIFRAKKVNGSYPFESSLCDPCSTGIDGHFSEGAGAAESGEGMRGAWRRAIDQKAVGGPERRAAK